MNVHWSLWVALAVLVLILVILSARREGYAPPRDENTQPPYTNDISNTVTMSNNLPYVDSTSNVVRIDNQTDVYKDMAGMDYQIQAGNPILNFIQGDPSSNVMYGDFVAHQSDGGSAQMYAFLGDLDITTPETTVKLNDNCPRSLAFIPNKNLTLEVGTHPIDKDSYIMNIYPPLRVVATGPGGERDERNYPATESCPTMVKLALDKEKMYDTLILTSDTTIKASSNPGEVNPSMVNTTYSGYALDMNGNVINPDETQTTITRDENALANLRYGFSPQGFSVTNSSDNALQYGFDAEGNLPPDSGQYIPTLTSPTTPFLGDQPGISA
jgi:hypothetical protein